MATQKTPTIIDQSTFEIKEVGTGKVVGKGTDLQNALALQTQMSSGGTPTISGRPDLYAIEPTQAEKTAGIQPIAGADGSLVQPRVATPSEVQQKVMGTLPSFNAVTGAKPPPAPIQSASAAPPPPTDFASVMREATTKGAQAGVDSMLTAPESFDNKLLMQKSVLVNALLGERLTPDDLRWLSPEQQQMVRESGPGGKANIEAAIAGLNTIFQGRKDLRAEEEAKATVQFDKFVASGADPANLPQGFLRGLDKTFGVPEGTHESIYRTQVAANEQERQQAEIESADKLLTVLEKLPPGKSIEIGGVRYDSLNQGDVVTGTETDSLGNTFLWSYNKDTGEKVVTKLGNFGSQKYTDVKSNEGAILRVYEDGTKRLMFDPRQPNGGIAQGGLIEIFPEGSVTPFTRPNDPNKDLASECGAWVNDCTGVGVGNTFQSKMAVTDSSITADTAQIGDVFVQPYGTTGHVGIINGKSVVDGEVYFTVSESNWSKVPGTNGAVGAITHTRQVRASEISGYARPGFTQEFYNFGTGATNLDGLTFGEVSEVDEPVPSEEIAKTTEAKKLAGIASLNQAIGNYRSLIEEYGAATGFSPSARQKLDSAKEAINLAIKSAEDLGALQAPDIELITRMIPDVTKEGVVNSLIPSPFMASRALKTLDQVKEQYAEKSRLIYDQLISRGDEYASDPYVQTLAGQLGLSEQGSEEQGGETIRVKRKSDGATGTILSNEFDPNLYEKIQ